MRAFCVVLIFALVGCNTVPPTASNVTQVTEEFVLDRSLLQVTPGSTAVEVVRDAGPTIGACRISLYVDGKESVKLNPSESVTVYLPGGRHLLGALLSTSDSARCNLSDRNKKALFKQIEIFADGNARKYRMFADNMGYQLTPL